MYVLIFENVKSHRFQKEIYCNLLVTANGLNDVTCDATSAMNSDTRAAADLHIFVETTWQFNEINPAIMCVRLKGIFSFRFHEHFSIQFLELFWKILK